MIPQNPEHRRILRFLLVGGAFSLIYSLSTAALISFAHSPPFWTSVIVYALCIPAAFLFQKLFVFEDRSNSLRAFFQYSSVQIATVAIVSYVTTRYVTQSVFWDTFLLLITAGIAAIINYFIFRFVVFADEET